MNDAEELFYCFFKGRKEGDFVQWQSEHSPSFKTVSTLQKVFPLDAYFSVIGSAGHPEVFGDKPSIISIKDEDTFDEFADDPIKRHISIAWWCQSKHGYHREIDDGPAVIEWIVNTGKIIKVTEKYYLNGKRVARPKKPKKS